ncbi:hypothetical protein F7734_09915 [Scytonema sp. UIC 10036]|uniref:hypothetical protein n=1 Tax=Scytonema sp. UIC 10036 TaxID=2304196 RepID=UPI0012DA0671|nr:hypothetical protein [Scytonema sp. UIC 10036]MUG92747.1 hypothetical protein [Scytonema sp. UIC 10036]
MNKYEIGQLTNQGKIKGYYIFNDVFFYLIQQNDKEVALKEEEIILLTTDNDIKKTPKIEFLNKTKEGTVMGIMFEEKENEFYYYFSTPGWVDDEISWYAESLITN